jgi:hypothetical protein
MARRSMQVHAPATRTEAYAVCAVIDGRQRCFVRECPGIPTKEYFLSVCHVPAGVSITFTRAARLPRYEVVADVAGNLRWYLVACLVEPSIELLMRACGLPAGTTLEFAPARPRQAQPILIEI